MKLNILNDRPSLIPLYRWNTLMSNPIPKMTKFPIEINGNLHIFFKIGMMNFFFFKLTYCCKC